MQHKVYITSSSSINPGFSGEPDYKDFIRDATVRRRMSRAVKMGVAAALQCLSGTETAPDAIITATGLGCLGDTEKFLKILIENGEDLLNPTPFIQSTFNTVGAQIAIILKNMNYNNTYVHRGIAFESALLDGMMKLSEGEAKNVLVGSYEELTDTSLAVQSRLGFYRKGNKAGEGAAFFLLSSEKTSDYILKDIAFAFRPSEEALQEKLQAFLAKNNLTEEDIDFRFSDKDYKPLSGDYQTVSSFALWLGMREMKERNVRRMLIHNHFLNINHTFILVERE
ncbi:MAG: beta-ketoacyl synthase chain length factor [Dysgonamonadaceae bacterium]|nr:beta-ketoacyl synthase chain length factor [Dysgonamonadaceae bacterium]